MVQYFAHLTNTQRLSVHDWEETQTPGRVTSARVSGIKIQDMPNQIWKISGIYLKVDFKN